MDPQPAFETQQDFRARLLAWMPALDDQPSRQTTLVPWGLLGEVGTRLSAAHGLREVVEVVLEAADVLLGWDACYVGLLDHDSDMEYPVACFDLIDGVRRDVLGLAYKTVPSESFQRALKEGPLLIRREAPAARREGETTPFGSERPSACLMFAPLRRDGAHAVGVLSIQSYTPGYYSEDSLSVLATLANYSGSAIARAYAEEALKESEQRYRELYNQALIGLCEYNPSEQRISECNIALARLLGYEGRNECVSLFRPFRHGGRLADFLGRLGRASGRMSEELEVVAVGGHHRWLRVDAEYQPLSGRATVMVLDVTERRSVEDKLRRLTMEDTLTGLPNRRFLMDQLELIKESRPEASGRAVAMLLIDLDRFKILNDSLGHPVGDGVLREVGQRIRRCLTPQDSVARLGSDEFAVLRVCEGGVDQVEELAYRILSRLSQRFLVEGHEIYAPASIGIAVLGRETTSVDELFRDADMALHRAKRNGGGVRAFFDRQLHHQARRHLDIERLLREELERGGGLSLVWQPICRGNDLELVGFEALMRWQPRGGPPVGPSEFIPIAEDVGLVHPLFIWGMRHALVQIEEWRDSSPGLDLVFAVNVSGRSLMRPGFVDELRELVDERRVPLPVIALEISERTIFEDPDGAVEVLSRLKGMGIRVYLDDFGTGFSSLNMLRDLPVHALKIDRSFISGISDNPRNMEIVRALHALGGALGLEVVAEGVETAGDLVAVKDVRLPFLQGFHLSHPLSAERAGELIRERAGRLRDVAM